MAKSKATKKWVKKEMNKTLFITHTVGHLEKLLKLEIGGLPRMLICFSLVEFGGRAFATKEEDYDTKDKYKGFFKLMFTKMAEVTNNRLYENNDSINNLYDGWRNGLAHMLVPTKDFSVGDNVEQRNNHMLLRGGKIVISDKRVVWDLIKTFDYFISDHQEESVEIFVEDNVNDNADLNYGVASSNYLQ
ncbi:MAG: hypothetical protein ACOCXP_03290 [Candidatus Dojkabacteria bacterium]